MNLAQLQARLKEIAGELEKLMTKDGITADDMAAMKALNAESVQIEESIEVFKAAEATRARAAAPAHTPVATTETRNFAAPMTEKPFNAAEKAGFLAVAMVKAKQDGGGTSPKAAFKALDEAGFGHLAREFSKSQERALNAGSNAAGGIFVPDEISNEIIDILRPATTFIQAGPKRVTFDRGNYHVPAAASGATAFWRGEGRPINPSQPTFRDINMSAKLLGALVPITDQLLRWSRIDIQDWVQRDMAEAMGTELDRAAYFGAGTVNEPLGVLNIGGIGSASQSGTTVAAIESDASKLELNMMNTNLPMNRAAWVMNPRSFMYLQNLRDGNGNRYFPELNQVNPTWRTKPVYVTTAFSATLGVGTNESLVALINFGDIFYGESRSLTFKVSDEASYVKNGQTVSAFQNELTLIRATTEVDVGMRYLQAAQVLRGVTWGA